MFGYKSPSMFNENFEYLNLKDASSVFIEITVNMKDCYFEQPMVFVNHRDEILFFGGGKS